MLVVVSPGPYARAFLNFEKKYLFLRIFFFVNKGPYWAKISKRYSSYKLQLNDFKLFLTFVPNGPHKTTFGMFDILKIEILTNFIRFR